MRPLSGSLRHGWRAVDGVVVLDKPLGLSSNEALQRARRLFRAAKGGHAGALDPLASGVLPLLFGEATKLSGLLLGGDKHYEAEVTLGVRTRTGDAEGEAVAHSDPSQLTRADLEAVLPDFHGEIEQLPPMYSALKRDGRPLYLLAREGVEVERGSRRVIIHALKLLDFTPQRFSFSVHCSKGTYVRTLAEDLAAAVGQAAHLSALRRTQAGPFMLAQAVTLDRLDGAVQARGDQALCEWLLPPAALVSDRLCAVVDDTDAQRLAAGLSVLAGDLARFEPPIPVLDRQGRLLGLADCNPAGRLQPRRWLRTGPEPL